MQLNAPALTSKFIEWAILRHVVRGLGRAMSHCTDAAQRVLRPRRVLAMIEPGMSPMALPLLPASLSGTRGYDGRSFSTRVSQIAA